MWLIVAAWRPFNLFDFAISLTHHSRVFFQHKFRLHSFVWNSRQISFFLGDLVSFQRTIDFPRFLVFNWSLPFLFFFLLHGPYFLKWTHALLDVRQEILRECNWKVCITRYSWISCSFWLIYWWTLVYFAQLLAVKICHNFSWYHLRRNWIKLLLLSIECLHVNSRPRWMVIDLFCLLVRSSALVSHAGCVTLVLERAFWLFRSLFSWRVVGLHRLSWEQQFTHLVVVPSLVLCHCLIQMCVSSDLSWRHERSSIARSWRNWLDLVHKLVDLSFLLLVFLAKLGGF